MTTRLLTLLIWAAVAATAVAWGLRLAVRATPVPAQASVAQATPPAGADLGRLLGQPPAPPPAEEAAAPAADARFRLVGVVAPRAGEAGGLAMIAVDGKAPQALAPGREVVPGLRLLRVSHRQAELGAAPGAPASVTLSLPALPEAARGRPGDAPAAAPPPGGLAPGQPPAVPGAPALPGRPVGLPPIQAVPMAPQAPAQPGLPVQNEQQ